VLPREVPRKANGPCDGPRDLIGLSAERRAREIQLRAERKAGELLAAKEKAKGAPGPKQALLAFQTAAHLATDAVVGPLTWRKLIEQDF
jgi:hypothetical protein